MSANLIKLAPDGRPIPEVTEVAAFFNPKTQLARIDAGVHSHIDAPQVVAKIKQLPGYTPWRPPTRLELVAMTDLSQYNPAVNAAEYPDIKPVDYWAAEVDASGPGDLAWNVTFNRGNSWRYYRNNQARVLAVCSPASQD